MRQSLNKGNTWDHLFWLRLPVVPLVRSDTGFFDHQYFWKESSDILFFCMELVIKRRQHLGLPLSVKCGQLSLSSNQVAQFFEYQCLWSKWVDILDFLDGDNHQEKVAYESTSFGQVQPVVLFIQPDSRILYQYLWKESSDLNYFYLEMVIKGRQYLKLLLFG